MAVLPALECADRFASFLEAGGAAHIENAFEHAVNLGWNGEIFSIVAKDRYRAPHTATVPPRVSFASVTSHVGRPTRTEGTSLVLSPECRIDFSRCARFSCHAAPVPTQTSRDEALIALTPQSRSCPHGADASMAIATERWACGSSWTPSTERSMSASPASWTTSDWDAPMRQASSWGPDEDSRLRETTFCAASWRHWEQARPSTTLIPRLFARFPNSTSCEGPPP